MDRLLCLLVFSVLSLFIGGCASTSQPAASVEALDYPTGQTAHAGILSGLVVGVTDGDTIKVLDDQRTQHKIRLAGIDAPEKTQAFGQQSKQHLSSLVFGRRVLVETGKKDRYERTVGKVVIDGRDANLAMVATGMAWHYKKYLKEQPASDKFEYSAAEQNARVARRGLWAGFTNHWSLGNGEEAKSLRHMDTNRASESPPTQWLQSSHSS